MKRYLVIIFSSLLVSTVAFGFNWSAINPFKTKKSEPAKVKQTEQKAGSMDDLGKLSEDSASTNIIDNGQLNEKVLNKFLFEKYKNNEARHKARRELVAMKVKFVNAKYAEAVMKYRKDHPANSASKYPNVSAKKIKSALDQLNYDMLPTQDHFYKTGVEDWSNYLKGSVDLKMLGINRTNYQPLLAYINNKIDRFITVGKKVDETMNRKDIWGKIARVGDTEKIQNLIQRLADLAGMQVGLYDRLSYYKAWKQFIINSVGAQ